MYDEEEFYPEDMEEEAPYLPEEEPDPFMPLPEDMPPDMQMAGLTPPYGTRREPIANPVSPDADNINQFIRDSIRQQEYGNMPTVARDVNEQADMIRGAAPRMPPQDIQRFLEEQMRGQGYMLPPKPGDIIDPEYEEDAYYGRRFG